MHRNYGLSFSWNQLLKLGNNVVNVVSRWVWRRGNLSHLLSSSTFSSVTASYNFFLCSDWSSSWKLFHLFYSMNGVCFFKWIWMRSVTCKLWRTWKRRRLRNKVQLAFKWMHSFSGNGKCICSPLVGMSAIGSVDTGFLE